MRVLWFSHVPPEAVLKRQGRPVTGTGFWIHSLVAPLRDCGDIDRLGVVYAGPICAREHHEIDGVDYYCVPESKWPYRLGVGKRRQVNRNLPVFGEIIQDFRPDLLHIHGTERYYGELCVRGLIDVPAVVSIQGLMGPCSRYAWGDRGFWQMLRLINWWEARRALPTLRKRVSFRRRARREREILNAVTAVIGRTDWDRAYTWSVNPEISYYHVDEMMRPEFYGRQWSAADCRRHRVYTSGRLIFLKGMHTFIEAMALLRREYGDLEVHIAGANPPTAQVRHLQRQVRRLGMADCVEFLGWVPAERIVEELLEANCYANASFIENGCNALQEAMLMGCPCVAPFAGGMATTLDHRRTGLMFPRGNAFMLADCVRQVFENNELAISLGAAAAQRAGRRHAPDQILADLLEAYRGALVP